MHAETIAESLEKFAEMIEKASVLGTDIQISGEVEKIFVAGMGGSGIAADLLNAYMHEIGSKIPVFIVKDYLFPEYINSRSLVFIVSYSGDTEETISAYRNAMRKGAKIVAITSGGKLRKMCADERQDLVRIPEGMQARAAMPYLFFPMLNILKNSGLIKDEIAYTEIISAVRRIGMREKAEELAEKLANRIPLIFTSERFRAVALRWKTQFNENTKIHAFCDVLPELDHNELMAFSHADDRFFVIFITDENDNRRLRQRVEITKELMIKKSPIMEIVLKGPYYLAKIFSAIYTGDLTSYLLAEKYGIDATEVKLIGELKEKLKKTP